MRGSKVTNVSACVHAIFWLSVLRHDHVLVGLMTPVRQLIPMPGNLICGAVQIDIQTGDKYYQAATWENGKMKLGEWKRCGCLGS